MSIGAVPGSSRRTTLVLPVAKGASRKIGATTRVSVLPGLGNRHWRFFGVYVHADREKFEQLLHRTEALESLGQREQTRWATIDSFETVPLELRVDASWLQHIRGDDIADIVIELQPVLARSDADRVLRTIADMLVQRQGEQLTGTGTDFSGRYWFRGRARRQSVRTIAKDFYSVQSIHSPLYSLAAAKVPLRMPRASAPLPAGPLPPDPTSLPCVAVVDTGIPTDHKRLKPYRRGQFYPLEAPRAAVGDHGSLVASRVVFGDCPSQNELGRTAGQCSFFDAIVAEHPAVNPRLDRVNDKRVISVMEGVRGSSPDVRVFNLSIGDRRALNDFPVVERREKRLLLQGKRQRIASAYCPALATRKPEWSRRSSGSHLSRPAERE